MGVWPPLISVRDHNSRNPRSKINPWLRVESPQRSRQLRGRVVPISAETD
jgi:hypothetical protein